MRAPPLTLAHDVYLATSVTQATSRCMPCLCSLSCWRTQLSATHLCARRMTHMVQPHLLPADTMHFASTSSAQVNVQVHAACLPVQQAARRNVPCERVAGMRICRQACTCATVLQARLAPCKPHRNRIYYCDACRIMGSKPVRAAVLCSLYFIS